LVNRTAREVGTKCGRPMILRVPASIRERYARRNMRARCHPPAIALKLHANSVVRDPQITVAAAHYRRGHDRLDLLRHHTNVGLVTAIVGEAVKAKTVLEMTDKRDVVLEHHVGSANDASGGPSGDTSDTDSVARPDQTNSVSRPDHASGPVDTGCAIDDRVCIASFDGHTRGERGDGERREYDRAHSPLLCVCPDQISVSMDDISRERALWMFLAASSCV